ncbi:MAG TPA: GGDEF domain-containing protein [Terriglobales bacterium]|nr:GGDEF domain-containing protein [Terriglobales bacterium]
MPLSRSIISFFFPAGVMVGVSALALRSEAAPMLLALHGFVPLIYSAAALLAWRFHSTRMLFAAIALAVADAGLRAAAGDTGATVVVRDLAAILLPANLVALSFLKEKGFLSRNTVIAGAVLAAQAALALLLCRPELQAASFLEIQFLPPDALRWSGAPQTAVLIFIASALFLAARFALLRNPVESGSFWALLTCLAAFSSARPGVWLMIAGAVLAVSVVENSYVMAFHDQLTGLPARRAFYRMASMLPEHYALAVADVDHFKRFNDTYGHEIGDQVLRMVASRMARVTGGGKAFRWGGEEFVILFPGKSAAGALEHLELLRQLVETSSFVLRGRDRGKHTAEDRGRGNSRVHEVWVTVSIGVAEGLRHDDLHNVMAAADGAVYTAKNAGRNRVETAAPASGQTPLPAAISR